MYRQYLITEQTGRRCKPGKEKEKGKKEKEKSHRPKTEKNDTYDILPVTSNYEKEELSK
jgi:hypothetical protein